MTPTARSMEYFRDLGFIVCRVEQRLHIPGAPFPITRDAFNFGDLLVAHPDYGVALVQVTSRSNLAARIAKIKGLTDAVVWIKSHGRIFAHGWKFRGSHGVRKRWMVDIHELVLVMNDPEVNTLTELGAWTYAKERGGWGSVSPRTTRARSRGVQKRARSTAETPAA